MVGIESLLPVGGEISMGGGFAVCAVAGFKKA